MVFIYTHPKTKEKYVLFKSSKNSNLMFFVKKSKMAEMKRRGHIAVDKPEKAKVTLNSRTGHPFLNY